MEPYRLRYYKTSNANSRYTGWQPMCMICALASKFILTKKENKTIAHEVLQNK